MHTLPGNEAEAISLLERKVSHKLWREYRILKKQQLFRIRGNYLLNRKELFPGYIFICTECPNELADELKRVRRFPQLIGSMACGQGDEFAAVENEDYHFLENVCGKNLEHDMRLSTVSVNEEGHVQSACGALKPYVGRITRQRLRHRYVTAKVPLFNRVENVLFGIRLEGDPE